MRLTRQRKPVPGETEISFPLLECWNPMTNVATIAAEVNKRRVLCRISFELLQERYDASEEAPMKAVAENRSEIQASARKLIEREAFEEDGSIVLRRRDF